MKHQPTIFDNILFKSRILIKNRKEIMCSASSILVGMLVNTMSTPELSKSLSDIFTNIFQVQNRPFNYLSWISLITIVMIPLVEKLLRFHYKKRRLESFLQNLIKEQVDLDIANFSDGRIAIGSSLTIQQAPDLIEGWKIDKVSIIFDSKVFEFSGENKDKYSKYFETNYDSKGFENDGIKYMVTTNPISFTDSPNICIELQKCRYSQIQFFKDSLVASDKEYFIKKLFDDLSISFPHSLSLHLIVITQDGQILTTLRSGKVAYFPKTWSVSLEEQLDKIDFIDGSEKVIGRWLKRLIEEETGINDSDYNMSNFRLLSLFLESSIMNCSLCGLIKLEISAEELDKILQVKPKKDQEFTEWSFLSYQDLKKEFLNPSRLYHPSGIYRIYLALINKYGPSNIIKEIWRKNSGV